MISTPLKWDYMTLTTMKSFKFRIPFSLLQTTTLETLLYFLFSKIELDVYFQVSNQRYSNSTWGNHFVLLATVFIPAQSISQYFRKGNLTLQIYGHESNIYSYAVVCWTISGHCFMLYSRTDSFVELLTFHQFTFPPIFHLQYPESLGQESSW